MLYIRVLLDWNKISLFEQSFFPSVMPCLSKSKFYREKFSCSFTFFFSDSCQLAVILLAVDTLGKGEQLI